MAKGDKKAAAPSEGKAKDAKYNSSAKRRAVKSFGDMSEREKVVAVVKKAASFAKVNNLEGLSLAKKDGKNLASNLNVLVKPNGRIEMLDDATFKTLKGKAGAALSEMKSSKYGSATKDLLNYCLEDLKGIGGGGSKGFTSGSVSEWSL
jgi:hypothetical protein